MKMDHFEKKGVARRAFCKLLRGKIDRRREFGRFRRWWLVALSVREVIAPPWFFVSVAAKGFS
jgi:hypothetical protein